jgi:predicted site-specific integrase-resolvase
VGPPAGGLFYKTAWRLWKAGQLPVPAEPLASGAVMIHAAPANEPHGVAWYATVFFGDQKADLDRQVFSVVPSVSSALILAFSLPRPHLI